MPDWTSQPTRNNLFLMSMVVIEILVLVSLSLEVIHHDWWRTFGCVVIALNIPWVAKMLHEGMQ